MRYRLCDDEEDVTGISVELAIQAARTAAAGTDTVRDVRFVLFSPGDLAVFQQAADALGA